MYFIESIIERVAFIDTVKQRNLDVSSIIEIERYFNIIISLCCNENVFNIKVRMGD
jgi:hypothetical protein